MSRQATALRDWIPTVQGDADAVVLAGDFNSYGQEDPLQVLYAAGYENAAPADEYSYSFSGLSGSLDHILINEAAQARSTGSDIWTINSGESIALEYSRYNYHGAVSPVPATYRFYAADPYRSSDHDPVLLGLAAGDAGPVTETLQVLGTNDFHGRIASTLAPPVNGTEPGAAVMATAVSQLRQQYPKTVFAAAGDLIGASTFESFIQQDKPTIDVLNAMGLDVSAVGNHEFDQGYADLTQRVMAPYDPTTNPFGGAEWQYLGANVRNTSDGSPALPEEWIADFGDVQIGFVGAVTNDLPELVSPAGIAGLTIEEPALAANRSADRLKAEGADLVILLVHEGAATTELESAIDPDSEFGEIVNDVDPDIDAIISGHTHLAYNHSIPVPAWQADPARVVKNRPVVSAGQYGNNLNQLLFDVQVDGTEVELTGVRQSILPLAVPNPGTPPPPLVPAYPADAAVQAIVDAAVAQANVLGAVELGEISGPFNRAKVNPITANLPFGTENRGGESTLGNLVAEVQQTATESPTFGGAQIAFMNPGGLRADMVGSPGSPAEYPAPLTYRQAANVQPFANTLVNMQLTGAQIKAALEQQWQPAGASRPFLRLGVSAGFTHTYDPNGPAGDRIGEMWLDGVPIGLTTSYSVTVNSFLAAGGDNFGAFATGTNKRDTGQVDLQAMVDYMADQSPVPVDYSQRAVGVSFPEDAPAEYAPGDTVAFGLSSLVFPSVVPTPGETPVVDTEVSVSVEGGAPVGTFPIDPTVGAALFDDYGTAAVSFALPEVEESGTVNLVITGNNTGTRTMVPITVVAEPQAEVVVGLTPASASQVYGSAQRATLTSTVTVDGAPATGTVEFVYGQAVFARTLTNGSATYQLPANTPPGDYQVTARYTLDGTVYTSAAATVTVQKATPTVVLLTSRTSYPQNALLPAILFTLVGLDNGRIGEGTATLLVDGQEVSSTRINGVTLFLAPRGLPRGAHEFQVRFVPDQPQFVNEALSNKVDIQVR